MTPDIQTEIQNILGSYGWMFLAGGALFLFKSTIESAIEGLKLMAGSSVNIDDVLIVNGSPARVIRVGLWKTTFFFYTIKMNGKPHIDSGNKVSIPNEVLKTYIIEKPLKTLDLSRWDDDEEKK